MSRNKIIILVILALISTGAQLQAQEKHADMKAWPELKNFHEVISQTYHPAEEGNLKPLFERSAELHDKAVKLADSKIPSGIDFSAAKKEINYLVQQTNELNEWIQKKVSDEEIKIKITAVHTSFHKLLEVFEKREHKEVSPEK